MRFNIFSRKPDKGISKIEKAKKAELLAKKKLKSSMEMMMKQARLDQQKRSNNIFPTPYNRVDEELVKQNIVMINSGIINADGGSVSGLDSRVDVDASETYFSVKSVRYFLNYVLPQIQRVYATNRDDFLTLCASMEGAGNLAVVEALVGVLDGVAERTVTVSIDGDGGQNDRMVNLKVQVPDMRDYELLSYLQRLMLRIRSVEKVAKIKGVPVLVPQIWWSHNRDVTTGRDEMEVLMSQERQRFNKEVASDLASFQHTTAINRHMTGTAQPIASECLSVNFAIKIAGFSGYKASGDQLLQSESDVRDELERIYKRYGC